MLLRSLTYLDPGTKDLSPESFFGRQVQEIQIESEEHKTKRRNKPGGDELMRRSLLCAIDL